MRILIVAPPRKYWPFVSEQDNFLVPQSLPYLGAILRDNGFKVRLLDCMPLKIGWKSLSKIITEYEPDIVGVGENHALYANEALKTCDLAKQINPKTICIVGGTHFSSLLEQTLKNKAVDFIVRGEGEHTLLELVQEISNLSKDFRKVKGIAYKVNEEVIITSSRPLIDNLDSLPFPAYDLLPMKKYGTSK
ncbi:MAG: cobalamin-dependent protein, partial [Candidatus Omnitrophica bacterium]|nr:cobalamin-dependent protein [Candidatus Omnitrophota bacterium]